MPILKYLPVILGTLLLSLAIHSMFQGFKISSLESTLIEKEKSITAYESAIVYQNEEVESQRADKENALMRLNEWNALPAKVKWKTFIKKIYIDVNTTKGEVNCADKKRIENSVYTLDWNNL